MAMHTLDLLDATEGPVVVPSGSCAQMIVHHYPELFAGTDREAQANRVAASDPWLGSGLTSSARSRSSEGRFSSGMPTCV